MLRGLRSLCRGFHSRAEHAQWVQRVVHARMKKPVEAAVMTKACAPFISTTDPMVDHLRFEAVADAAVQDGTPAASFLQATWPISTHEVLANSVADHIGYSPFRLAKFYEAVDALTADVAYRHTDAHARGLALVTASHYHAIKLRRTIRGQDVTIRCYVTNTGSSSLEVRTDALQEIDGEEWLINVCHTAMVALDNQTMQPRKGIVPALVLPPPSSQECASAQERLELAKLHKTLQLERGETTMALRSPVSHPPTPEEMVRVHDLHRTAILTYEAPAPRVDRPDEVSYHTHQSCTVIFEENRNVHGKAFGGFVAGAAYDLAYFAAKYFTRGAPFVPVGLDEAVFLQPVAIGDMVRTVARVVHSGEDGIFRVLVHLDVIQPTDPGRLAQRTNRLMFVFITPPSARRPVLPKTYSEVLMHVDAARRHASQGLGPHAAEGLASFFSGAEAAS